ncbi:hypothetical protein Cni_G13627 [Canna indica]|uniref:Uncharacterized protein n=1 Tax=Canna indica TaxID=4628 RepID=A0AAQ3QBN8_9LILI|nr:hypothetical protein Cni_G13627 [Canna indica]
MEQLMGELQFTFAAPSIPLDPRPPRRKPKISKAPISISPLIPSRVQKRARAFDDMVDAGQETHIDDARVHLLIRSFGRKWDGVSFPSRGASGGLILAWDSSVISAKVLFFHSQGITAIIGHDEMEPFLFTTIYASTNPVFHNELRNSFNRLDL